ncbi:MAG: hypothetical protein IJ546_02470 [Prevotella sp.]|nr:hypothetical protein [Prevotella sp.]
MEITINGQLAVLKKNTSFEYISENSLFTGSDSYTLTITFPLKDCPQNIRIFGHIHRQDVEKNKVVFDCEIRDKTFYKAGIITVTNISEVEVKTQFLEGRSEQNFDDSFDDVFLNQLNLGYAPAEKRVPANNPPYTLWGFDADNPTYVALPWVNNTSGNLQNAVTCDINASYSWTRTNFEITFQPYLLYILNKICEVMGYTGDFTAIRNTNYRYLLICNTLPSTWGAHNFAIALPHWSLTEFFEQLEYFLAGEFIINHKAKTIVFRFNDDVSLSTAEVMIDKVVNKYSVDVSKETKSEYIGYKNLMYAENDNRLWAFRDCQWYIDEHKDEAIVYDHFYDLVAYAQTLELSGYERYDSPRGGYSEAYTRGYRPNSNGNKLFYARDIDTYFIMWCYKAVFLRSDHIESTGKTYNWYQYYNRLEPINQFGKFVVDKEAEDIELHFVPAWIDDTDEELGPCLFLECGEMGSAVSWTGETDEGGNTTGGVNTNSSGNFGWSRRSTSGAVSTGVPRNRSEMDETDYNDGALAQGYTAKAIAKGEIDKSDAYFDCIYMGYWDQTIRQFGYLPHPTIDTIEAKAPFNFNYAPYSMRLKDIDIAQSGLVKNIDPKKKYKFSFMADEIPDPRAIFFIEGRKYVCEKITATFHEDTGKSQLLTGDFYLVEE